MTRIPLLTRLSLISVLFMLGSGAAASQALSPQAASDGVPVIVFIGDSLTAGYGVKKEEAFPEKVQALMTNSGHPVRVINGGISGSVTAEADSRVKWFLRAHPSIIVLELGGNDGLKGTPPAVIKKNLDVAIQLAQKNAVKVLLLGMQVYTNFGESYTKEFSAIYPALAKERKVALDPFLLEGVAMKSELNQSDMKHPNAKGHAIIAERLARELEKML